MSSKSDIASGRWVLVTGGTTGIGRMIAEGFAAAGDHVAICGRTRETCELAAQQIADKFHGICVPITCDISTSGGVQALLDGVSVHTNRLHTLVNNAGSVAVAQLEELKEEDWDRVVDINLKAVFFCVQKLIPLIRTAARPEWPASIINIGSFGGVRIGRRPNYAYLSAKAGMHHLTKGLAKWLAPEHVNVNAIATGVFPSEITKANLNAEQMASLLQDIPKGRLGEPRDVVGLTRFLASDASAYITGATIPLDGGMQTT